MREEVDDPDRLVTDDQPLTDRVLALEDVYSCLGAQKERPTLDVAAKNEEIVGQL